MSKRITIVLEDDLYKKLRQKQAKLILETTGSVSLSQIFNEMLRKSLK